MFNSKSYGEIWVFGQQNNIIQNKLSQKVANPNLNSDFLTKLQKVAAESSHSH